MEIFRYCGGICVESITLSSKNEQNEGHTMHPDTALQIVRARVLAAAAMHAQRAR